MEFDILKDALQMGETTPRIHRVDTFSGTPREAIEYARMHAMEHADRIIVKMYGADFGAYFTTSNGTFVRYYATERN